MDNKTLAALLCEFARHGCTVMVAPPGGTDAPDYLAFDREYDADGVFFSFRCEHPSRKDDTEIEAAVARILAGAVKVAVINTHVLTSFGQHRVVLAAAAKYSPTRKLTRASPAEQWPLAWAYHSTSTQRLYSARERGYIRRRERAVVQLYVVHRHSQRRGASAVRVPEVEAYVWRGEAAGRVLYRREGGPGAAAHIQCRARGAEGGPHVPLVQQGQQRASRRAETLRAGRGFSAP